MRGKPIDQGTATRMGQRIEALVVSYEVRHLPMSVYHPLHLGRLLFAYDIVFV